MVSDRSARTGLTRWVTSAFLGAAVSLASQAQALSVYHIGNSLVLQNEQRVVIKALAIQAGHAHAYSMSVILGAPLSYIWSNPASSGGWEGQPYPAGLAPSRAWDALILEPYDRDFRFYPYDDPTSPGYAENDVLASNNFYNLALAGNPRAQLFIYEIFPLASGWSVLPEQRTLAHALTVADQVNKLHPSAAPVIVIPAGDVIQKLGALADQNQLPHVAGHAALFGDEEHLNEVGTYAVALTHLVCLHRDDPHGYSNRPVYPPGSDLPAGDPIWQDVASYQLLGPVGGAVWPETAAIIKDVVAEVTLNSPRSGVDAGLRIATAALPPGVVGQSYGVAMTAELGVPPYQWSVVGGALPPGLRLEGGTLSGAPTAAGTTALTVQLSDSSTPPRSVTRSFTLSVAAADVAFAIDMAELPVATRGTRFAQVLHATGGVAPITWSLESGRLPVGVALGSDGALQGSPGEDGTFAFTVLASDGSTNARRSARRSFTLVVAPLGPATVVASRREQVPCGGGRTAVAPALSGAAARSVGTTDNELRFTVQWDDRSLYVALQVRDNHVITATADVANSGDAVELFVNADNAKSILYGARDRRVVVGANGAMWLPDGRDTGISSAQAVTADGYRVELVIPWANLGIVPRPNITLGFDVANHDDDGTGRTGSLYWYGGPDDANLPAAWGNLLLAAPVIDAAQPDAAACDDAGAPPTTAVDAAPARPDVARPPVGPDASAGLSAAVSDLASSDAGVATRDADLEASPVADIGAARDGADGSARDDAAASQGDAGAPPVADAASREQGADADQLNGREAASAGCAGCAIGGARRAPHAFLAFLFIAGGALLGTRQRGRHARRAGTTRTMG